MSRNEAFLLRPLAFLLALAVAVALAPSHAAAGADLTVREAHDMASRGEIILVDIRSPGEWRETGVAPQARTVSMHESGFFARLAEAVGGDRKSPIALICSAGGRSTMMQAQLALRGYTNVSNVPAGMSGGPHGPGWIASGLPVMPYRE